MIITRQKYLDMLVAGQCNLQSGLSTIPSFSRSFCYFFTISCSFSIFCCTFAMYLKISDYGYKTISFGNTDL